MSSYPPPIRDPADASRRGVQGTSLSSTDPASAIDATTARSHVGEGQRDRTGSATEGKIPSVLAPAGRPSLPSYPPQRRGRATRLIAESRFRSRACSRIYRPRIFALHDRLLALVVRL